MIYFRLSVILLILVSQPLLGSEKSSLFTVDMSKLFRSSHFGKRIVLANNKARQELQDENEELEAELLLEEKELSEIIKEWFVNSQECPSHMWDKERVEFLTHSEYKNKL